jgi:hypothetical protein
MFKINRFCITWPSTLKFQTMKVNAAYNQDGYLILGYAYVKRYVSTCPCGPD